MSIQVGDTAPHFALTNQHGQLVNLNDGLGHPVVVYFYPKALTPGCSQQAQGMRDIQPQLVEKGIKTLAISPDKPTLLARFAAKFDLNFDLLADEGHLVCEQYGIWQLKKFMGREYMGVVRTTFIINAEGIVVETMNKMKCKSHHEDVLASCHTLF